MAEALREWRRGWPTALTSCLGVGMLGGVVIVTGVVMAPITQSFGWSRAVVSTNIFIIAFLQLVLAPVAGAIIARFGVRRYAIASVAAAGPGLLLIASAGPAEASWYGAWIVFGIISVGLSPLVWSTAITTLFDRSRGLALATALSGGGLAYLVLPSIAVQVTAHFGWRAVYIGLAAVYLFVVLPVVAIGFRSRADLKQPPAQQRSLAVEDPTSRLTGFSLAQAFRRRQFWQLAAVCVLAALVEGGLTVHLYPILNEGGLDKVVAAQITSLMGLALIFGRLCSGILFDRIWAPLVMAGEIALMLLSCLLARVFTGSVAEGAATAILFGLGAGGTPSAVAYLTSRYFGLAAYASVLGLLMGVFGLGYGFAPLAVSHMRDLLDSYEPLFAVFASALGAALVLVLLLGRAPMLTERDRIDGGIIVEAEPPSPR